MIGPWSPHSPSAEVEHPGGPRPLTHPAPGVDSWSMGDERQRVALFQHITVAVDGSRPSIHAFELAMGLAKTLRASLALVTVIPSPPPYGAPFFTPDTWDSICQAYEDELHKLESRAKSRGISKVSSECRQGVPVDQILEFIADHPTDLLVVGARGLSASRRAILGSVSDALVHDAPCPVLVIRENVRSRS
jgi:nucleotide-binding universal stress UspA family protein